MSVAECNLGISDAALAEQVAAALLELGATEPASAVITEYLAQHLVHKGIHSNATIIGHTLGHSRTIDGHLGVFAHYLGGRREPWQGYVWSLPINPPAKSPQFSLLRGPLNRLANALHMRRMREGGMAKPYPASGGK